MRVDFDLDQGQAQKYFGDLIARGANLLPLMQDIGEFLTETSKQRFQTSTAPDGTRWAPNAPATYLAYLNAFKGSFGKDGRITKRGTARAGGKKPLIGETGRLGNEIAYAATADHVDITSGLAYSAIHQFGGQAGRGRSVTIPARPYLGISASDDAAITDMAGAYLADL